MSDVDLAHIVSVSGGKDSTATLLLARERGIDAQLVFADTQHEHPLTYEYLEYLDNHYGPIRTVKADFSRQMEKKRKWIENHWFDDLTAGREGHWEWRGAADEPRGNPPPDPLDPYSTFFSPPWKWVCAIPPWTAEDAHKHVQEALETLQPTGNAFLDLCLWKGRFPSTRRRFCSEELKHAPIRDQVVEPLQKAGKTVVSWQGVRADESRNRAMLDVVDQPEKRLIQYRPIITWSSSDVLAMHTRHGVKWNPLYEQGMGRVGCMPCIHVNKRELAEIAKRWPEVIDRIERWESLSQKTSKYKIATFGDIRKFHREEGFSYSRLSIESHGIREYVRWAKTPRGGDIRQEAFDFDEDLEMCSSIYGLCESAT